MNQHPFSLNGVIKSRLFSKPARLLERGIEKISGLSGLDVQYQSIAHRQGSDDFLAAIFQQLNMTVDFDESSLSRIPKTGPVVVVANHPFGGLDGIILMSLLRRYRSDVKVLANYHLAKIPQIKDCFISVDPFATNESHQKNLKPMKESIHWLKQSGLLLTFPAGEVSSFKFKKMKVLDTEWSPTIGRLINISGASAVPVYFKGRNSLFFNALGFIHPLLRTLMLPRELLNKRGNAFQLTIGESISNSKLRKLGTARELVDYLRLRTYMLASRKCEKKGKKENTVTIEPSNKVIEAIPVDLLKTEIRHLPQEQKLLETNQHQVFFAESKQIPWLMQEIGRLREVTFRAVGEGTGNEIDIDLYDAYYTHIFIWHEENEEIVGAYRLGVTKDILQRYGKKGLYTYSLFHYKNRFVPKLHNAIELGRSFVRSEYQKNLLPLNLLWKGIGRFVCMQKDCPVLFGPVSISQDYEMQSKQLMIKALKLNSFKDEYAKYVKPRNPFKGRQRYHWRSSDLRLAKDMELVSDMVSQIESDNKGIPILVKQYLKLGGKFLGFNVDPNFSDVVDGLIVVDLRETDLKVLRKYMGDENTHAFLSYFNEPESVQKHA